MLIFSFRVTNSVSCGCKHWRKAKRGFWLVQHIFIATRAAAQIASSMKSSKDYRQKRGKFHYRNGCGSNMFTIHPNLWFNYSTAFLRNFFWFHPQALQEMLTQCQKNLDEMTRHLNDQRGLHMDEDDPAQTMVRTTFCVNLNDQCLRVSIGFRYC